MWAIQYLIFIIFTTQSLLPPVQATGAPAGSGQALPAAHAVQFSNLPPNENIPVGHGTGGLLKNKTIFPVSLDSIN